MMRPFADRLLDWFDRFGRHDLPWQHPRTPYRVWVSEIMLQQTQVSTVIGYFNRFMTAFPRLSDLAEAHVDEVLALWSGLGYYARARNLHRAAGIMQAEGVPVDLAGWQALPGVGPSTAAAILAQSFDRPATILDGNVKRVMARHAGIDQPLDRVATTRALMQAAETRTPDRRAADYTQAIMDLGATICRRSSPHCTRCPVRGDCVARLTDRMDELPRRKVTRVVPRRQRVFLLIRDAEERTLLLRRPPSGIWGGLWCLPECETTTSCLAQMAAQGVALQDEGEVVHHFSHRFSHFLLDGQVRLARVETMDVVAEATSPCHWLPPDLDAEAAGLGVPAPMADLLRPGRW